MAKKEEVLNLILKHPTTQKVINTLTRLGLVDNSNVTHLTDIDNLIITNLGIAYLNSSDIEVDLSWIDEYRNMFKEKNPVKVGTKLNVVNKMKIFLQKFNYTKEDVLGATKLYLDNLPGYGDREMSSADYFISFQSSSADTFTGQKEVRHLLLKWIEIYKDGSMNLSTEFIEKL
jgi:hypothetical protein